MKKLVFSLLAQELAILQVVVVDMTKIQIFLSFLLQECEYAQCIFM